MKALLNSFHLNGHTLGFHPQTYSTAWSMTCKVCHRIELVSAACDVVYSCCTTNIQTFHFTEHLFLCLCCREMSSVSGRCWDSALERYVIAAASPRDIFPPQMYRATLYWQIGRYIVVWFKQAVSALLPNEFPVQSVSCEMSLICCLDDHYVCETHFQMNCFAGSLVLRQRQEATRKWVVRSNQDCK